MMGIRLDRLDGQPVEGVFAILHTVLFWGLNVVATPLILIASLLLDRKRTVHDLLPLSIRIAEYHPLCSRAGEGRVQVVGG